MFNLTLWICQVLLAALFSYSGWSKTTKSAEELVAIGQTAVENMSPALIKFIGISELLGVLGIILPWLSGIFPILTPLAAIGFSNIMVLAAIVHFWRGEMKVIPVNLLILAISLFVAWGRLTDLKL